MHWKLASGIGFLVAGGVFVLFVLGLIPGISRFRLDYICWRCHLHFNEETGRLHSDITGHHVQKK